VNELIVRKFGTNTIRSIIDEKGQRWWVAKDVAEALGYQTNNIPFLINHVPEEWKGRNPIATPGGQQEMLTLSMSGLFFFLNRSDKPMAIPLQKWVNGEVLTSIAETGSYVAPGAPLPPAPKTYKESLLEIVRLLEVQEQKDAMLEAAGNEVLELIPKAEAYDAFLGKDDGWPLAFVMKSMLMCIVDGNGRWGKPLGIQQINELLRVKGVFMQKKEAEPMQQHVDSKYFFMRTKTVAGGKIEAKVTMVTPKGVEWLFNKLQTWGYRSYHGTALLVIFGQLQRPETAYLQYVDDDGNIKQIE
jgi:prophage antirepressor-like protein